MIALLFAALIATPDEPMRVSGDNVIAPVVIKRVEIDFKPCIDRKIPIGMTIIEAVIDKTGVPRNVRLLKQVHPCVKKQVLAAVNQWRFRPGTHRGKPVDVIYNITVTIHYR